MSNTDYKVHKCWVDGVEFEILVLEIPQEELEDKLAYLARDKGNITRSFYEDFVIATCVANINQLIFHIKQQALPTPELLKVREEIMGYIVGYNSNLDPDNLVINRNSVIKIKGNRDLEEGERMLADNKNWNIAFYDESFRDPQEDQRIAPGEEPVNEKKLPSELKDLDELEYEVVKKWWQRINKYIQVKTFKEEDMESIISRRYFHDRSSFQTFIVSICVVDAEGLFEILDNMGIPNRVAPPILMDEIYKLCYAANPFLTYENAKKLSEDLADDEEDEAPKKTGPNRMSSHARSQKSAKKKKTKTFKDIPKQDLINLGDAMKVAVIGQDEAVDSLVDAIQRASVGLKDPVKPIGSFLFAGRTGIGKTLATKVLANELIKEKENLINIDCSEYSADHEYAKLIGAPSGYVGHEQGGILTNAIQKNPFSVVVFDEVEKASHKVHELLLQILEEGRLTDGKGTLTSFKDAVIVLTSNVGVKEVDDIKKTIGFGDVAELTEDKKDKALKAALKSKFKPEFLNRIDSIISFKSLNKENYMRIIDIELYKLNENLRNNDTEYKTLTLEFDKRIRNLIFKEGIDEDFGARPLKRCIETMVSTPLAQKLLKEDIEPKSVVKISAYKGKASFKIEKLKEPHEEVAAALTSKK
jgi:ATP-dependent Clp protease ATP-binding subunit ClpC